MKNIQKYHWSEITMQVFYVVMPITMVFFRDVGFTMVFLFLFWIIGLLTFSALSLIMLRRVSIVLWPMYLFIGASIPLINDLFTGTSGAPAGVGHGLLGLTILLIIVELILCFIFARKDFKKVLALMVTSFVVAFTIEKTFITPVEYGERGADWARGKYLDWRVVDGSGEWIKGVFGGLLK